MSGYDYILARKVLQDKPEVPARLPGMTRAWPARPVVAPKDLAQWARDELLWIAVCAFNTEVIERLALCNGRSR